jgi:hypothetical protein
MHDLDHAGIGLVARLQRIAPVNEQDRAVGKHNGAARRSGESCQPRQALFAGRQVLVLLAVGVRDDKAFEAAFVQS